MTFVCKYKGFTVLKVGNLHIKHFLYKKLLGINFDYKLNFAKYFEGICQKASRKLTVLARLAKYMTSSKTYSNDCFLQVAI